MKQSALFQFPCWCTVLAGRRETRIESRKIGEKNVGMVVSCGDSEHPGLALTKYIGDDERESQAHKMVLKNGVWIIDAEDQAQHLNFHRQEGATAEFSATRRQDINSGLESLWEGSSQYSLKTGRLESEKQRPLAISPLLKPRTSERGVARTKQKEERTPFGCCISYFWQFTSPLVLGLGDALASASSPLHLFSSPLWPPLLGPFLWLTINVGVLREFSLGLLSHPNTLFASAIFYIHKHVSQLWVSILDLYPGILFCIANCLLKIPTWAYHQHSKINV